MRYILIDEYILDEDCSAIDEILGYNPGESNYLASNEAIIGNIMERYYGFSQGLG